MRNPFDRINKVDLTEKIKREKQRRKGEKLINRVNINES